LEWPSKLGRVQYIAAWSSGSSSGSYPEGRWFESSRRYDSRGLERPVPDCPVPLPRRPGFFVLPRFPTVPPPGKRSARHRGFVVWAAVRSGSSKEIGVALRPALVRSRDPDRARQFSDEVFVSASGTRAPRVPHSRRMGGVCGEASCAPAAEGAFAPRVRSGGGRRRGPASRAHWTATTTSDWSSRTRRWEGSASPRRSSQSPRAPSES
jgi:hypothetical protein